jgi:hypothetical protein
MHDGSHSMQSASLVQQVAGRMHGVCRLCHTVWLPSTAIGPGTSTTLNQNGTSRQQLESWTRAHSDTDFALLVGVAIPTI